MQDIHQITVKLFLCQIMSSHTMCWIQVLVNSFYHKTMTIKWNLF